MVSQGQATNVLQGAVAYFNRRFWGSQHPAPIRAFFDVLIDKIQLLVNATAFPPDEDVDMELRYLRAENDTKPLADEAKKRLAAMNLLAECEFKGFTLTRLPTAGTNEYPELLSSAKLLAAHRPKEWLEKSLLDFCLNLVMQISRCRSYANLAIAYAVRSGHGWPKTASDRGVAFPKP